MDISTMLPIHQGLSNKNAWLLINYKNSRSMFKWADKTVPRAEKLSPNNYLAGLLC